MKDLSIRFKLLASFTAVSILFLILSGYGFNSSLKASKAFKEYKNMTRDTVLVSRVQENMLMLRMNMKEYIHEVSKKKIKEFDYYYKLTDSFLEQSLQNISNPVYIARIQKLSSELKLYKKDFYKIVDFMYERNETVHKNLDINGKEVEQLLTSVALSAKADGDIEGSRKSYEAIRSLLLARLYTAKYLASNKQEDASRVYEEFIILQENLIGLNGEIQDPKRSENLQKAVTLIQKYKEGVQRIVALIKERNKIIFNQFTIVGPEIAESAESLKFSIKKDQDTIENEVTLLNENLKNTLVLVAVITILLVLFLAFYIRKNIILRLEYLHEGVKNLLSSDTISARVPITNNDEIGAISKDFNNYLQSVENDLLEDKKLVHQAALIAHGNYEVRISPRNETDTLGKTLQGITESLRKFTKIVQEIAEGNLETKVEVKSSRDYLAISVNKMVDTLQVAALHAGTIAEGNYESNIEVKGSKDVLGNALYNMTQNLRKALQETLSREWLQSGQAKISDILREDDSIEILAQKVLQEVVKQTNAKIGAAYMYDEAKGTLEQVSSYALAFSKKNKRSFMLGEGLVGQAGKEGEFLTLDDIPEGYLDIESGLGEGKPTHILIVPFSYKGNLRGVIELAYINVVSEDAKVYLESLREKLGIACENLLSKERLAIALEESQTVSETLQAQEEELRVSNEKLIEQSSELLRQKENLEESKNNLEIKAKELLDASRYKSEFLANMSHELRTPLNSLLILSRSLAGNADKNLSDEEVESAVIIQESGEHLLSLINNILDISKVEAGQMNVNLESIEISGFVKILQKRFSHMAEEKNITFNINTDAACPESFVSDSVKVEQIVTNLIANAIKFTHKGSVEVSVKLLDEVLSIAVCDTGIGIAETKRKYIFEAFKQEDGSTTRNYGGTGLGLAIAANFADLLDGDITVDSKTGEGSTFTLLLPYIKSKTSDMKKVQTRISKPLSFEDDRANIDADKNLFLIIEDDENFAKIIYDYCKERGDLAIVANDGESGIKMAQNFKPTGIMLDYMLPGINGIDVLSILKTDQNTRAIPIHVMSAVENLCDMKQYGAAGQLQKPINKVQIQEMINTLSDGIQDKDLYLLVFKTEEESSNNLEEILSYEGVKSFVCKNESQIIYELSKGIYSGMIIDFDNQALDSLQVLEKITSLDTLSIPHIIIHSKNELSEEENKQLQKYTSDIIIESSRSAERLLDEIKLFIHQSTKKHAKSAIIEKEINLKGRTVLLVDDDMRNIYSLAKILRQKKMTVYVASNAEDALKELDAHNDVEMILTDIMMPEMDGYELIKEIRKQERFKDIPIAALTANAMKGDKEKCLEAGANDYVSKPIDVDALFVMMKMWL